MRFSGKTAIITGGATGIGATYSRAFAAEGANVVIADILKSEGEALAQELNGQNEGRALFISTDVTDDLQTTRMAEEVASVFGNLHILVNNAAVYMELGSKKAFDEITLKEWEKTMAVNVRGVWHCAKAVSPHMKRHQKGKIINISSVVAYTGAAGFAHYVASKAAVIGLTRALARELGAYNITVNAVAPGLVSNESSLRLNVETYIEQATKARSLQRTMTPEDLIGTVLFLASPESDFISGQTFVVDGGAIMR